MVSTDKRSDTALMILRAAKDSLLESGYAGLSTRSIAEEAGVPLSQIHYHFGSKQNLVLAVLEAENQRLLDRQESMFQSDLPLWRQWEQACDYLDEDIDSGYVRVLHEMVAVGWSDPLVAKAVWDQLGGWYRLLTDVARRAERELGGFGPFTAEEISVLAGAPFLATEMLVLLGVEESEFPAKSALRKIGQVIRSMEEHAT